MLRRSSRTPVVDPWPFWDDIDAAVPTVAVESPWGAREQGDAVAGWWDVAASPTGDPLALGQPRTAQPDTPRRRRGDAAVDSAVDSAGVPPGHRGRPWNRPGPDLDCADIGFPVIITGTDYHNLDADGDGRGCESYG